MVKIVRELLTGFRYSTMKKSFLVVWAFIVLAMVLFFILAYVSTIFRRGGAAAVIVQGLGFLMAFTCFLMAFAGVYQIVAAARGGGAPVISIIKGIAGKTHYYLAFTLGSAVLAAALVAAQAGLTALAYIPYAGPVFTALLTALFFMVNIAAASVVLVSWAVLGPLTLDAGSLRELAVAVRDLLKKRWLHVLLYLVVSLSVLFLAVTVLYFFARHALGITRAIQWKINAAYPKTLNSLVLGSYAVDIVKRITPAPDPMGAFLTYGPRVFDYLNIIKKALVISYAAVFSFIAAFPTAVYFCISSIFFDMLRKSEK